MADNFHPSGVYGEKCAAIHLGMWLIEAEYLKNALAMIRAGQWNAARKARGEDDESTPSMLITKGGTAIIPMIGHMAKGDSKYGGVNTLRVRGAVRAAASDSSVKSILMHIDSPGGTVAGTGDLAADVARASAAKPLRAHIDDLGASAAFWVASQTDWITANATAEVGGIGTIAVVEDTSKAADLAGVKVHVVASSPAKGAFVDGVEIREEDLSMLRKRVMEINEHFVGAVASGRSMTMEGVGGLADGRTHMASRAKAMKLIDGVGSFDEALQALESLTPAMPRRNRAERIMRLGA